MTTIERLDKYDRQTAAIRTLIQEGMRLGVETREDLRTVVALQKQTQEAQKRTGGNGHAKRRLDIS